MFAKIKKRGFHRSSYFISTNSTQRPALVLPSRTKTPIFCKAARSRFTVFKTRDKTRDICCAEILGLSLINLQIFICLSDS